MVKKGHARSESLRAQVYGKLRSGLRRGGLGTQQVATERDLAAELGAIIGRTVKFVMADGRQIDDALRTYYAAA